MDVYETETLSRALAANPSLANGLRNYLEEARARRREQLETATGELAIVFRGRCQELTAIINELTPIGVK